MRLAPFCTPASGGLARRVWLGVALGATALHAGAVRADDTDVEIEVESSPAPAAPIAAPEVTTGSPSVAASLPDDVALQAELADLKARLTALEAREAAGLAVATPAVTTPAVAAAPAGATSAPRPGWPTWVEVLDLRVSGYVQPQFQTDQTSSDELSPDGDPLNTSLFVLRRGRVRVDRDFRFGSRFGAHADAEVDANTVYGPVLSPRRLEVSVRVNGATEAAPPRAVLTAGLSDIPFGFEMTQGNRDRLFMERTVGSRAFFVGDTDVGVTLSGAFGPLRYAIAAQNGVPLSDSKSADNRVYTAEKTLLGRVGFDTLIPEKVWLAGGVSFLSGAGFSAGSGGTKSTLQWSDKNQDGFVSLAELTGASAQAATPSSTFHRWGVAADLELGVRSPLGWSRVYVEGVLASNLDRGFYVADPIATGYDLREIAWSVAATQDVTRWTFVGFRAESYNGDADLNESRRGEFIPTNATTLTLSPAVGVQIPHLARLSAQYDYVVDFLGRDVRAEPIDLPNDRVVVRAQVEF